MMDFRIDVKLPRHWKYKRLKSMLGEPPMEYLILFWSTVAEQMPNGALNGWSEKDVELAAEWSGKEGVFCDAMVKSGLLDVTKEGFYPHDWAEHQPWVVGSKERVEAARKAGKASAAAKRARAKKDAKNGKSTGEQRAVEESLNGSATDGQRSSNPITPSPSPSPITTPYQVRNKYIEKDGEYYDRETGELVADANPFDYVKGGPDV